MANSERARPRRRPAPTPSVRFGHGEQELPVRRPLRSTRVAERIDALARRTCPRAVPDARASRAPHGPAVSAAATACQGRAETPGRDPRPAATATPARAVAPAPPTPRRSLPRRRTASRRRRSPRSAPRGCLARRSRRVRGRRSCRRGGSCERRWAITIAVRPWSRRSRPFSIVFSVRTSTLEVASSRIRIRGSASRARAKATSWRWPAESVDAALADLGLDPVGQAVDEVGRADRGDRLFDLLEARLRAGRRRRFRATLPLNRKPSWGTIPSWRRSARCCTPLRSWPSTSTRPFCGS